MFKIGQKVVCVDVTGKTFLRKGNIYTVKGLSQCPDCGVKLISVVEDIPTIKVCKCGYHTPCRRTQYMASRFRPLQYDIISNKDIIKETVEEKSDVEVKEPEKIN